MMLIFSDQLPALGYKDGSINVDDGADCTEWKRLVDASDRAC